MPVFQDFYVIEDCDFYLRIDRPDADGEMRVSDGEAVAYLDEGIARDFACFIEQQLLSPILDCLILEADDLSIKVSSSGTGIRLFTGEECYLDADQARELVKFITASLDDL